MNHPRKALRPAGNPSATTASFSSTPSSMSPQYTAVDGDSIFGPSHPLHSLVAAHLPDVLTRLVLAYQSPLLPRQQHYRGHIQLPYGAYGFRDQRVASMAANPLSLARRSFSWSGWMNRAPRNHRYRNYFLLSFEAHDKHGVPSQWLHVGYRQYYARQKGPSANRAFTFAFNGNDLDARPAHTDLEVFGSWEHWSGSFEYPRTQTTPPIPPPPKDDSFTCDAARFPPAGSVLGRRRLYRNGQLLVEDDCLPLVADVCSTLSVGNYQNYGDDMTIDGGVCDVRLYSRVLSEAEMRALYEGEEREVSSDGLEAHWPLERDEHIPQTEGAARRMMDVSGNERHLEVIHLLRRSDSILIRYQLDGQL